MKNLHFYIQSVILIIALSIAVQVPFNHNLIIYVALIEIFVLSYQLFMSCLLMSKLSRPTRLLKIHFFGAWFYIVMLIVLSVTSPTWMEVDQWGIALMIIPWSIAILFLVTLDELERLRGYQL